ncbi:MAG: molybdopterin-dependent oxidoreductase [Coriobacteriales bacterium]|jgi:anaerobic selenocysteine-containing dehydrogenase|nr:molybdopterin-dependent oxidoreductase [Coriobacteriales bacterium]
MEEKEVAQGFVRSFTRRSFIKGAATFAAATAATGAVGSSASMLASCSPTGNAGTTNDALGSSGASGTKGAGETQIFAGACRGNCGGGCFLNIHVRDNKVVRTSARDFPNTEYNRICTKGLTHVGRIYGPNRLLYPMKRVGARGSGDFERITWDEALDTIATKWQSYIEKYGPSAIMFFLGSGNYSALSGSSNWIGAFQRFVNSLGCSYCSLDVDAAISFGSGRATGGIPLANELTDRKNAKTQVIWGNNPTISLMHTMHFFMEAKEKGTRFIVIDPVYNATASKADWWLPVRGGTDGALALAVLNVLVQNGWVNDDTFRSKTNADLLIKEDGRFLRMSDLGVAPTEGEIDPTTNKPKLVDPLAVWDESNGAAVAFGTVTGITAIKGVAEVNGIKVQTVYENAMSYINKYPPAKAASMCGLSEDDIYELARVYYEDGPVTTEIMMGMNHYRNGHYTAWPVFLVGLLTGNVGKPGAAIGQSEEYMPQLLYCNSKAAHYPLNSAGTPAPGQAALLHTVNVEEVLRTGTYQNKDLTIKSAYIHCSNPVVTMCDHDYTTGWFDMLDFVVVADICMTETCKHADIILPSAHWFEQVDLACFFSTHPYMIWQEKAIEPLGEAMPDFKIFGNILDKLGLGEYWCTEEEYLNTMLDNDYWRSVGCTVQKLKTDKVARIYPEGDHIASAAAFGTETGRISLYQENITKGYTRNATSEPIDESIEHGLYWETPVFAGADRDYRKDYPYHLLSEHMRTHTHTQWWDCEYVKEYEAEPIVRINPNDAAELGISEGDVVRLSNDQGFVVMKAAINAGLPRKMISSARSWQKDDFIDGHFASLPSKEYNQVCANQAFNDVAVKIEKL